MHRLNGVHRPFWRDWPVSDPCVFLTSEPLHHWHKQFWDHDFKWCLHSVGSAELDFRFSILPPHTGYRHFKEGISKLKQVTGREHRDIQRYIIPVIADAVEPEFVTAIRGLLDFRYYAQSSVISDDICGRIEGSLKLFHQHKDAIMAAGARKGKKGPIDNWNIPKLEFLQSVVLNIKFNGVACQWSADVSENAHISVVKDPARSVNNKEYESQICRHLDRVDKVQNFELATAIRRSGIDFRAPLLPFSSQSKGAEGDEDEADDLNQDENTFTISSTSDLLTYIATSGYDTGSPRKVTDYFYRANLLRNKSLAVSSLIPPRTYQSAENFVYHLSRDPNYRGLSIDHVAKRFKIPDLHPAIADFINNLCKNPQGEGYVSDIGRRRLAKADVRLSVTDLDVWNKIRIQTTAYHHPNSILPPFTANASPPLPEFPDGHFDQVMVNVGRDKIWPKSGISGITVTLFQYCNLTLVTPQRTCCC